jgi:hypothetical protein
MDYRSAHRLWGACGTGRSDRRRRRRERLQGLAGAPFARNVHSDGPFALAAVRPFGATVDRKGQRQTKADTLRRHYFGKGKHPTSAMAESQTTKVGCLSSSVIASRERRPRGCERGSGGGNPAAHLPRLQHPCEKSRGLGQSPRKPLTNFNNFKTNPLQPAHSAKARLRFPLDQDKSTQTSIAVYAAKRQKLLSRKQNSTGLQCSALAFPFLVSLIRRQKTDVLRVGRYWTQGRCASLGPIKLLNLLSYGP